MNQPLDLSVKIDTASRQPEALVRDLPLYYAIFGEITIQKKNAAAAPKIKKIKNTAVVHVHSYDIHTYNTSVRSTFVNLEL